MLQTYNIANLKTLEPFRTNKTNLRSVVRLPLKFKHLKVIPVEQFCERMNHLGQVRPFPWWGYCSIALGIVT